MAGQSYQGTVKSFNPHKGWGFVECPALNSDAFIIKSELRGYGVVKGDQISFQINQGPKGLSAVNIQVLNPNQDLFFGEVKSWNQAKGFGFVTSIATQQLFAKDVFALQGEFRNGFGAQGIQVMFRARNAERGPVASDITVLGPDGSGGKGGGAAGQQWGPGFTGGKGGPGFGGKGAGFGGGYGGGYGGGWGGDFSGGYAQQALPWKAPAEETVYYGTLKGVNPEKGWGHIASEAMNRMLGKDIFVMKASLDGKNVHLGQAVSFAIEQGPKGPHAVNIQPFDAQSAGMVFSGTVKSFNDVKGWGFVESPQAKQIFRSDFFIHKRELQGKVVHVGDQVQFAVDISGGRASARNVSLGLGGARAAPGRY